MELQGDEAVQPGVLGLVHHSHAAPAELLDDAVVRDGLADHAVGAMLGGARGQVNGVVRIAIEGGKIPTPN